MYRGLSFLICRMGDVDCVSKALFLPYVLYFVLGMQCYFSHPSPIHISKLPIHLSTHSPTHPATHLPIQSINHLAVHLSHHLSIHPFIYPPIHPLTQSMTIHLPSTYSSIHYQSKYLLIHTTKQTSTHLCT